MSERVNLNKWVHYGTLALGCVGAAYLSQDLKSFVLTKKDTVQVLGVEEGCERRLAEGRRVCHIFTDLGVVAIKTGKLRGEDSIATLATLRDGGVQGQYNMITSPPSGQRNVRLLRKLEPAG